MRWIIFDMSSASPPETTPVWAFEPGTPLNRAFPGNNFPETVAEIWLRAGKVPLDRILMAPAPGTATSDDAVYSNERFDLNPSVFDTDYATEDLVGSLHIDPQR